MLTAGTLVGAAIFAASAAPALACPGANETPAQLTVKEARVSVTCLINQRRRNNGLPRVRVDIRLERAAQKHSRSMDAANFFDHESPNGSDPISRIQATGYLAGARSWAIGENIRWGSGGLGTPRVAVEEWMASSSHRHIMLSGAYREIGIGVEIGSPVGPGNDAAIYTADFGFTK